MLLFNNYGPTEATIDVSEALVSSTDEVSCVSIGKPHNGVTLHVLNRDLQPCSVEERGQIAIEGFGLARGYINKAQETAKRFCGRAAGRGPVDCI